MSNDPWPEHKWSAELQCCLENIEIDFLKKKITLNLPPMNCTDMSGAIALCQRILPDVMFIQTTSDEFRDTAYVRSFDGKWRSVAGDLL